MTSQGIPLIDPLSPSATLNITADEAISQQGYMVESRKESSRTAHWTSYTARRLPQLPRPSHHLFVLILIATLVLCVVGGLFTRFYALPSIGVFKNYARTNCTVLSYYEKSGRHVSYYAKVTYTDTYGVGHNASIKTSKDGFGPVGTAVECVYSPDGKFVETYDGVASEYAHAEKVWFCGFFIPLDFLLNVGILLLIGFLERQKSKIGTTHYYPRSMTFNENSDLVITNLSTVAPEIQQFLYLALLSYYSQNPRKWIKTREVTFSAPKKQTRALVAMVLFVAAPVGLTIGGGFCLRGYQFSQYLGGLFMLSLAITLLPGCLALCILISKRYDEVNVDNELCISYRLERDTLIGNITRM